MLNKYPEIWLRELVMLVDLQTSSIFSPSPRFFLPLPCPLSLLALCQPTKGRKYKGENQASDTQPNYYWSVCTQRTKMHSPARTHTQPYKHTAQICLNTESPVMSSTIMCLQLICNTDHSGLSWTHETLFQASLLLLFPFYGPKIVSCNSTTVWFVV